MIPKNITFETCSGKKTIALKNKVIITTSVDNDCNMAKVKVNNLLIMTGNFWDFHPGCHGINLYGDFKTYWGLASKLKDYIRTQLPNCDVSLINSKYTYK